MDRWLVVERIRSWRRIFNSPVGLCGVQSPPARLACLALCRPRGANVPPRAWIAVRWGNNYPVLDATTTSRMVGVVTARWIARLSDYLNAARVPSDLGLSPAPSGFVQQGSLHLSRRKWSSRCAGNGTQRVLN